MKGFSKHCNEPEPLRCALKKYGHPYVLMTTLNYIINMIWHPSPINVFHRNRKAMTASDMATSLDSSAHNVYGLSLLPT